MWGLDDRLRFDELVARDLKPYTIVVQQGRFALHDVAQDLFTTERIVRVELATKPLKKTFYLAATSWRLLTGHVDSFNALAEASPLAVPSPERAREIARLADTWTTTWENGQLEISSFADIPWRSWLEERDKQVIEDAREKVGGQINAEHATRADGEYVFTTWVIASAKLLRRTLAVGETGRFRRVDEVVLSPLPIPLGRYWKMVDGRLVPSG